jgi:glycosyltransferase involved in cell wall biosynthesis
MKPRSVVFASYNGLLDPLGSSQILPYLERLHPEWRVQILSFERAERLCDSGRVAQLEARLARQGIGWTRLRYHKWPSLAATTWDVVTGMIALRRLMAQTDVALIHSRSYVTNTIALNAAPRVPLLFDIRGLQADEYVDGGVWRKGELKWRLAKASERRFFRKAAAAVMLTQNIRPYVAERFAELGRAPRLEVIPCCVDLSRFRFDAQQRAAIRARLAVPDAATLFVYSGSLGTWYLSNEMARFVRSYGDRRGGDVRMLWMVNGDEELARRASRDAGLDPDRIRIVRAQPDEVPGYLSAADVGLALIKPSFSKRSSSPTKYAEYLAMGLPLLISRDVGDGNVIVERGGGVALERFDEEEYATAADALAALREAPRDRFRELAAAIFDIDTVAIPAYRRLYRELVQP